MLSVLCRGGSPKGRKNIREQKKEENSETTPNMKGRSKDFLSLSISLLPRIKRMPLSKPLSPTWALFDFCPLSTTTITNPDNDKAPNSESNNRDPILLEKFRQRKLKVSSTTPEKKPPPKPSPTRGSSPAYEKDSLQKEGGPTKVVNSFGELGLSEEVIEAVEEMGAFVPTEIQCVGIPAVFEGKSVVMSAQPNSGRTLAYLLPLVQLMRRGPKPKHPQAVVPSDRRFNDVLCRRFLRNVRFKERRRGAGASIQRRQFSVLNTEDEETEQLRASVDFLVELCDTVSPVGEANFANWAHQAVDFILASLKNLLPRGKDTNLIEGIVNSLIMRLVRRMCSPSKVFESLHTGLDAQFYVQHLIRKLGSEAYVGQRAILSVSQRISVLAESFLFLDPFDDSFPGMHGCMFTLIQLIEFLISDYLLIWSSAEGFDKMLFEEWVASILHARKALELLESRNGLYVLYMDRVTGELAKQVGQSSSLQKLKPEILDNLFH